MFTAGYKSYFLRILFSSEKELGAKFSLVIEISQAEGHKPVATIYVSEPIATEKEGILRGFEVGRQWIDKTSPQLSSPVALAERTIFHSEQLLAELHYAISNSFATVSRSENLIRRSRNLSVAASAHCSGSPGIPVAPRDSWQRSLGCTQVNPRRLVAEHLAQRAVNSPPQVIGPD
jgi:hypothetical protein